MPDSGRSQPIQSHTATEQWRSFEVRMRQRRAERCVIRADVALEAGVLDDAEASLEEARRLDANVPGLETLAGRLVEARAKRPARPLRLTFAALATAAVVVMAAGAAATMWRGTDEPAAVQPVASTVAVTPAAQPARPAVGIVEQFVTAPVTTTTGETTEETTAEDELPPPPRPRPSAANATAPAPEAPSRAVEAPPPPVVAARTPEPETTPPPPPPAPAPPPPVRIDPVPAPRDMRTADVRTSPPSAATAKPPARAARDEPVVDDVARVRAVLSRYEAAYSGLDAAAARAVWPAVDERALARAFSGLQSQRVSLERCDVSVSGASARADCAGRATWVPKVGGNGRTESRRWRFDLEQASDGWQIVSAEAR